MKSSAKHNLIEDYHLLSFESLDSTNEEAKRLAGGGASHGAVIWAKKQTAGKGRLGHEWISEEGNLFVSVLLAPPCELAVASQLSFVTATAVIETLLPLAPGAQKLACKWPNDIMLGKAKLGGILLESFRSGDPHNPKTQVQWVVVGVGINVESHPEDTAIPATSLKEAGVEIISAKIVLSRFIYNFIQQYDLWMKKGFAPIRRLWLEHAYGLEKKLEVRLPNETFSGTFKGIDKTGRMEVLVGGKKRLVSAGDVFFGEE